MLSISKLPKKPSVSRAFFASAKDTVLGTGYQLSVAFVTAAKMQTLNARYRGKSRSTDILSFPLGVQVGEIVFCMKDVAKESVRFGRTTENFLKFLFIHGLVHLKGYEHGATMEKQERKFRAKFKI